MYMVGLRKSCYTIFKPGFIDTLNEAKEIGEKENDSKGFIVIQKFESRKYFERLNTREGYLWIERLN